MSTVDLVFVTTDEGAHLMKALESLFDAEPRLDMKIFIVDNASTDGAAEEISNRWPDISILRRERRYGLPANLNHGIVMGASKYVMLCNSDLLFTPGSISNLISFFESRSKAGIAAPRLVGPDGKPRVSARRWYTLASLFLLKGPWKNLTAGLGPAKKSVYGDWDFSEPRIVDWVPCPATMVRRAAFEETGVMDERFRLYFDDVDVSLRMYERGWEVWSVPTSEIIHLEQRSSVAPFSQAWRWHLESLIKFIWKHNGLRPRQTRQ